MNTQKLAIFLLSAFLILIIITLKYENIKDNERNAYNISVLKDSIVKQTLKNGDTVVSKRSLIVSRKELEDQIFIKDSILNEMYSKLKNVNSAIKIESKINYKDISFKFKDTIDFVFNKPFEYKMNKFSISGISTNKGIDSVNVNIDTGLRIVTGVKENMFKYEIESLVSFDNENINVIDIQSQHVDIKKSLINLGITIGINPLNLKPQIVLGVNLPIKKF